MADTKISALPASTTPLAGTEVLPIVQSNVTKQVSVANLTAGRAISATQLTLTTGNLVVASGQGIDFSATPGTGTSELLADYEEGDWTPTLTRDVPPSLTYTNQVGKYVKVGRQVTLNGSLFYTVTTGGSGLIYIGGFPFAANATSAYSASGSAAYVDSITLGADALYTGQNGTGGVLTLNGNFATGALTTGRMYFTITYQV
ncbi:hypothetical protein UFOVP372_48 [uncultured Caudovirales phage]|uniref:Uncharacterized protein n=1 Tax=uncultured Caudovirales phage TaxID=2100421 RepID=A0A6J7WY49_9CAUD|nr:hypothetical protein UFOVP372_48 [uncultured Caudovirales phage]